jgi:GNAT superfamily N-acetyltransferase
LSITDRQLRFGYLASDAQIGGYVEHIDFGNDEVFGIFDRRLAVVAMAHLAYTAEATETTEIGTGRRRGEAEFGVSVDAGARGRGWGAQLFELAALHARNRGVDTLVIHALVENAPMLRIIRAAGAQVVLEGPDAVARLALAAGDARSHLDALMEHQMAEFDYGFKLNARCFDILLARY